MGSASDSPRACGAGTGAESWRAARRARTLLQAEIAACHARARTAEETDWQRIVTLYEALARIAPSPVIDLNRAVAVSMAFGPAAGLDSGGCADGGGDAGELPSAAERARGFAEETWATGGSARGV